MKNGIVYLITDGTYIKIGYTKGSIKNRIEAMQTGNANKLEVMAFAKVMQCEKIEKYLHVRYGKFNHRREWFMFDDESHVLEIVGILRKAEAEIGYAENLLVELNNNLAKKQTKRGNASARVIPKHRLKKIKSIQEKRQRQHDKYLESQKKQGVLDQGQ